jgi:hypothetical protein
MYKIAGGSKPDLFIGRWYCRYGTGILLYTLRGYNGNRECLRDPGHQSWAQEPFPNGQNLKILFTAFASEGNFQKTVEHFSFFIGVFTDFFEESHQAKPRDLVPA